MKKENLSSTPVSLKFTVTFFFIALITLTYSLKSTAYQFTGVILKNSAQNQYFLQITPALVYPLDSIYSVITQQVSRLNSNDFISFNGHFSSQPDNTSNIMIDSIDYVGLSALLGVWKTYSGQCFYFKSHTNFIVKPINSFTKKCPAESTETQSDITPISSTFNHSTPPSHVIKTISNRLISLLALNENKRIPFKKPRLFKSNEKYTYFINPDVVGWNMLITSDDSEFIGELKIISATQIDIQLFDSQTDANLGVIELRR